mgnify:CR=1 FL=1
METGRPGLKLFLRPSYFYGQIAGIPAVEKPAGRLKLFLRPAGIEVIFTIEQN